MSFIFSRTQSKFACRTDANPNPASNMNTMDKTEPAKQSLPTFSFDSLPSSSSSTNNPHAAQEPDDSQATGKVKNPTTTTTITSESTAPVNFSDHSISTFPAAESTVPSSSFSFNTKSAATAVETTTTIASPFSVPPNFS